MKAAVIGAGMGGSAFLPVLIKEPHIEVIGISDTRSDAPGFGIARVHNIPVTNNFMELLDKEPDIVINVTGDEEVQSDLLRHKSNKTEIIDGKSAKLVWDLLKKHQDARDEVKTLLDATNDLYRIGVSLLSSDRLDEALTTLLSEACRTLKVPAGSVALYDDKSGLLTLMASQGFSFSFSQIVKWKAREGGLTERILSRKIPTVIADVEENPFIDNNVLMKEGIKSLMAVPLFAGEQTIGILYLDDFQPRTWAVRETEFVTLLGIQAAYAIEKFHLIETITEAHRHLKLKIDELEKTEAKLQSELIERKKAEEKIRQMSLTDELTGLNNRRGFLSLAHHQFEMAKRLDQEVLFIFADIDGLKWINDNLGHEAGDMAITDAATILRATFRASDIIARMGGDEFTIFAMKTTKSDAGVLVRRLEERIGTHNSKKHRPFNLSLSIGISAYNSSDPRGISELLSHADNLMYEQKKAKKKQGVA